MKFSIGHRLFAAVLLAIVAVTATGIALMRQHLLASFSTYAVQIELDRLQQLSDAVAERYRSASGWQFLPADAVARRSWISEELARLQAGMPLPPTPPQVPAPPMAPADAGSPPLPPLPPPLVAPAPPGPGTDVDLLALQQRITLTDADGRYLAGRPAGSAALARRAVQVEGRTVAHLAVAQVARPSDALAAAFLDRIASSVLLIVAISVALSALLATLLAAHFRKPIQQLADGARALADGRYDSRLDLRRSDELGELAQRFNQMAARLGEMEAGRRQWVADTSHELRTPLSVLRAQLEALQDGVRAMTPDALASMLRQVLALNKLIDELYALAQADAGQLELHLAHTDAWQLAADVANTFGQRLAQAGLELTMAQAPALTPVMADPDRLRQVFVNLFENAIRYTAAPGRVALRAQVADGALHIDIDDSAPGVPAGALERRGERFYRVEGSRSRAHGGAGLGLALCRRIVAAHQGALTFSESSLGGLRVRLSLPL